jgi:predicted O-methyltransferase YrrM
MSQENKLKIKYTNTIGLRLSKEESPTWADSYGVTESLAKKYNVKKMAEIGVARGHHSAHLLEAIPDLHLYVIDPWGLYESEHISMWKEKGQEMEKIYQKVLELLKPFSLRANVLRLTSEKAVSKINEELDMVFIDADHSYESVKKDINLWWKKIKIGGIISGHDYHHTHHPGVTLAVNEFFESLKHKVNGEIGNVWWVEKKFNIICDEYFIKKILRKIKYKTLALKLLIYKIEEYYIKNNVRLKTFFKFILGENIYKALKSLVKKVKKK